MQMMTYAKYGHAQDIVLVVSIKQACYLVISIYENCVAIY